MKSIKGITLIALVITIVVLLILAGVSLSLVLGNNGVINKATEAKNITEKSQFKEEIEMLLASARINGIVKNTTGLQSIFEGGTIKQDNGIYEVTYKGNTFLVSSDYEYIEKIEPSYEGEWTFDENTQTLTAYNGDLTIKRGNQDIGELIIPNYYNGKRVKTIKDFIFTNNTSLTKLTISEGIEKIERNAFADCSNLKDLIIPNSLIRIEMSAFIGCGFEGCLKLGQNIEYIGPYAFYDCNKLTGDLIIPDSVIEIGGQSFQNCTGLNGKLILGKKVQKIDFYAFFNCNKLTGDLIIPDNVTEIGNSAFCGCKGLNGSLQIGQSVQKIGESAFWNCHNLTGDLIIPDSVTEIGRYAFIECGSLSSMKFLNRNTEIYDNGGTIKNTIKIIGYEGSTAEIYANKYSRTFEKIPE